jgi:hypothetical protein
LYDSPALKKSLTPKKAVEDDVEIFFSEALRQINVDEISPKEINRDWGTPEISYDLTDTVIIDKVFR